MTKWQLRQVFDVVKLSVRNQHAMEEDRHVSWKRRHRCDLTLDRHVAEIIRCFSYHMRALGHIRPLIDLHTARMVAQGVVTPRLDYSNGLLYRTFTGNIDHLQVAQNINSGRVSSYLVIKCHGPAQIASLAATQQIEYKLSIVTFKAQSTGVPAYLASLLHIYMWWPEHWDQ